ncbi:MAG: hypothetical protein ACUVR3_08445 [Candidatus Roseilinea sp.]
MHSSWPGRPPVHPLWITETGIRHWEGYAGSPPPGARYAWPDEAASFLIQNYTYALHKNAGRYYTFAPPTMAARSNGD